MAWNMSGQIFELCNCDFLCPCWFDPTAEPDQGYCRSAWTFDVHEGQSDGIDLSERKVVLMLGSESTLANGNLTARLYVDSETSADEQRELEAIFGGQRGGPWEAMAPLISTSLPTIKTDIEVQWGDNPRIKVGDHAEIATQPVYDPAGSPTMVSAATVMSMAHISEGQPAKPSGGDWNEPNLGNWEPRSSMVMQFNWRV